ncbi:indoleacetamide hydrolase [Granulosicoccus antarcticus]|uniref:Mandelamide hydrolase n=1 Tax=Granulosicoccus antarcticus IMCC3135 TaxID=1192854 RepID=A0A2Z2NX08_9GAMM|nr:indoleacetamide hydrolase [Granulosicoccus antarcticus]ASJ73400.1 Mandelamide hydrolase [Granulosicoccus antarcticus IMCC3135]
MATSELIGAAELKRRLEKKDISAAEFAADVILREKQNTSLNAISSFDPNLLMENAKRADQRRQSGNAEPLCGIPLIVKDNINTVAFPTTAGTTALQNHTPATDAGVIVALEGQGAIIAAKSGMHELAFGVTSNNSVTGAIRNPHDQSKIPGGSSGGTAAAVAAGIFPAGLGTDTGASVRLPAALCGIVGFRPTVGRYASNGIVPISHTRDTAGTFGNKVEDIVLLDSVLSGSSTAARKKDINQVVLGICREVLFENLEPEVEKAIQEQLKTLESAGARLVEVNISDIWSHNEEFSFPVVLYEVMRDLPAYLKEHAPEVSFEKLIEQIGSPDVAGAFKSQLGGGAMPETAYQAAINEHRPAMRAIYAEAFAQHNLTALAFPTSPLRATDIGSDETVSLNGEQVPTFPTFIRNTDLGSNLGVPGISLPCQNVNGLPIGIEFDGVMGRDQDLLELALTVEEVLSH